MENQSDTKKCPFCAETIKSEAIACKHCGRDLPAHQSSVVGNYVPQMQPTIVENRSIGLSVSSLVLGILAIVIGLVDLALISDGTYMYLDDTEIGILAILSLTSLGLGITSKVKQQRISVGALSVSIVAVVIFVACTSYSVPTY
jgi:hypothetical protein